MLQYLAPIIVLSVAVFGTAIAVILFAFGVLPILPTAPRLNLSGFQLVKWLRSLGKWLRELIDDPAEAATVFAAAGVGIAVVGYVYLRIWGKENALLDDFYANFAAEFLSIAVTVLIIDRLSARRAAQEEKKRILRQMASHSNDFALEAVRLITENGWMLDGSLRGVSLNGANLKGAHLEMAELIEANLTGAHLEGAHLQVANLGAANLSGASLKNADLAAANLWKANLERADLEGTNLRMADLSDTNLRGAKLENTRLNWTHLRDVYQLPANLPDSYLGWINLKGATYDLYTSWPDGFDPTGAGAIEVDHEGLPIAVI